MTLIQTVSQNSIFIRTNKQKAYSAEVKALFLGLGKSATEPQTNLLRCENVVKMVTFKIRTLNTIKQLHKDNIDYICEQERRYYP